MAHDIVGALQSWIDAKGGRVHTFTGTSAALAAQTGLTVDQTNRRGRGSLPFISTEVRRTTGWEVSYAMGRWTCWRPKDVKESPAVEVKPASNLLLLLARDVLQGVAFPEDTKRALSAALERSCHE